MTDSAPLRPADLARLLLAGGDLLPRARARDQQADLAGMQAKRDILQRVAALDPDPNDLDATLEQIVRTIGPPYGPTRGICLSFRYDWESSLSSPEFATWLLDQAVRESAANGEKRKRRAS